MRRKALLLLLDDDEVDDEPDPDVAPEAVVETRLVVNEPVAVRAPSPDEVEAAEPLVEEPLELVAETLSSVKYVGAATASDESTREPVPQLTPSVSSDAVVVSPLSSEMAKRPVQLVLDRSLGDENW